MQMYEELVTPPKPPIDIIGAGIAGLVTAARLATAGHAVTVFEAAATFGGKMQNEAPRYPMHFDGAARKA